MQLEWLLVAATLAIAARLLGVRERYGPWPVLGLFAAAALGALANDVARERRRPAPIAGTSGGFATSDGCRSCHPQEYTSWHGSFHRRMTQTASLESSAAPELRQGGRLHTEASGRSVELFARRGELWARLPDPALTSAVAPSAYETSYRAAPLRDVPVELLTGSHHQQAFWVKGARDGELCAVPAVYVIETGQLLARRDAFLNPPDAPERAVRWNSNCIQCHTVAGAPGHDVSRDVFRSRAAELGVACEACHGAAAEHARAMQNPLARYRARAAEDSAPGVMSPRRLSHERSSEICGRCHSYFFPKRESEWWSDGFSKSYRPGQVLSEAQLLLSPEVLAAPDAPQLGESAASIFYQDGTVRVGGREYNGLERSPCYQRGVRERRLSCTSCHSMHRSDPDAQLAEGMAGNRACTECHERHAARLTEHTHHSASSAGSLCYNCHMPYTSYALLGAVRSHRVDSPSFDERTRDRPNACNLCHLEQSESWAAGWAARWFGDKPALALARDYGPAIAGLPAAAVFALTGDAAVRAITAAALGRHESGSPQPGLRAQLLRELEQDEYAAVRFIARRSLGGLPAGRAAPELGPELVSELKKRRDTRPVTIAE